MLTFDNYAEPKYRINGSDGVIIGRTEVMIELFHFLNQLADLPTTVLLRGETGTGKELCAKALHYNGKNGRREGKFVAVNCAGIPSELLESELFGYVKGAFTGAYHDTPGKFQYANGGTILLDEIGDMNGSLQAKILRVLQEKEVTKVGSNRTEKVDVRIIAATNVDLEKEVERHKFREDLYYRLNVVPISVPSLRQRTDDIPLIAEYFIERLNQAYGAHIEALSLSARDRLKQARWRGNIRELENVIERAFVLRREGVIEPDDLFFNSDMPRRVLVQQAGSTSDGQVEGTNTEERKPWYHNGVLPISPKSLSRVKGAKSRNQIYNIANGRDDVYVDILGKGERRGRLILYLTSENMSLFFRDTGTEEYRELERTVRENEFNQMVNVPFKLFTLADLLANSDTLSSRYLSQRAIKKAGAYHVDLDPTVAYAITPDNVDHFVPVVPGREFKVDRVKAQIVAAYEKFKAWRPS